MGWPNRPRCFPKVTTYGMVATHLSYNIASVPSVRSTFMGWEHWLGTFPVGL